MRKFMVLACVLSMFAISAIAAETGSYPKAEFFGGYQYTRLQGGVNANGFDFALNGNFNNYLGITAARVGLHDSGRCESSTTTPTPSGLSSRCAPTRHTLLSCTP